MKLKNPTMTGFVLIPVSIHVLLLTPHDTAADY